MITMFWHEDCKYWCNSANWKDTKVYCPRCEITFLKQSAKVIAMCAEELRIYDGIIQNLN